MDSTIQVGVCPDGFWTIYRAHTAYIAYRAYIEYIHL